MGDDTAVFFNKPFGISNKVFVDNFSGRMPRGRVQRPEVTDSLLVTKQLDHVKGPTLVVDYISKDLHIDKTLLRRPFVERNKDKVFTNPDVHCDTNLGE